MGWVSFWGIVFRASASHIVFGGGAIKNQYRRNVPYKMTVYDKLYYNRYGFVLDSEVDDPSLWVGTLTDTMVLQPT